MTVRTYFPVAARRFVAGNAVAVLALAVGLVAPASAQASHSVLTAAGAGDPPDSVEFVVDRPVVDVDNPSSGAPTLDVRGTSTVSVANLGWTGTVGLVADRTSVDANSPTATLTIAPSTPVVAPYSLSVYDDTGVRLYRCTTAYTTCVGGTIPVKPGNNATRTYTAYVSRDTPPTGHPVEDVQAQASVQVRNLGWLGSVALSEGPWISAYQRELTLAVTPEVAYPYFLTVYDGYGSLVYKCGTAYVSGGTMCSGGTFSVYQPAGTSRSYFAFVSLDAPKPGPPTSDVRASSGLLSTGSSGPTAPYETAGGSNPSEPCSQTCHGDPINSTTGEFWETTTDIAVAANGPEPAMTRSYGASRASIDGPLGHGWTHAYDMQLSIRPGAVGSALDTASQVQVRQENGSLIVFARDPDGRYVGPERTMAKLERLADGTYRLTRAQSRIFRFDATGRLMGLQDRNGNTVTLTYDGDHLLRATDDSARFLEFTWAGTRIASVADHTGRTTSYTYSAAGDLTSVVLPDSSTEAYTYDSAHRVLTMTGPDGGVTTNVYDGAGRAISQTDPLGRTTTLVYGDGQTTVTEADGSVTIERYVDGQVLSVTTAAGTALAATTSYTYTTANQVRSITDPRGRVARYTYDVRGNRTSVTDPLGRVTMMTYDVWNDLLTVTNPAGETASFTYDERGNLLTGTDPSGAVTTYTVNADGTVATATDATGLTTSYTYDANGFLASARGPDGSTVMTAYDSLGRMVSSIDPRGQVAGADPVDYTSTATYDAVGRVLTTTNAEGAVITAAYDAAGRPTTTTNPLGATSTSEYDLAGQLTKVTDALGNETTFTYDGAGRVLTVTDATGATATNEYDALGRLVAVTDPLGRTSSTEYDAGNRVTATVTPSGARTSYTYDAADQLLSVTNPLGKVTTTTYDAAGRPVTVTDADGRAVTTTYDAAGRPTKVTRADGSELSWTYDAAGRVLTSTDAAGAVTTYTYDAAGRRATATDVAGRVTSYTHGPSGLLDVVTLPGGGTVSYAYDAVGRRTGIDYSDATPDVTYVYDDAGRTVRMLDGTGTATYSYDDLNRLTGTTHAGASVGYAWDDVSRLTALTYPSGDVVTRTYDDAGQLATVTDWADREFGFDWTDDGQLAEVSYPNGVVTSYERDVAGQVTGLTAAGQAGLDLLELAYGYSDAGLMTDRTTTRGTATESAQFAWDPLARLDAVTGTGAGDVGFDAAGSVTALPDGRQFTYDAGRQLATLTVPAADDTVVSTGFTYDARGNRLTATTDTGANAGTVTHTYDLANRLTSITGVDEGVTTYAYDGNGLRASATTGEATESFTWDLAAAYPLLLTDADHAYIHGTAGVPLAQIALDDDSAVDYLHADTLGSVLTTTDATGMVNAASDYDEYGLPQPAGGAEPIASVTRFGYAGEYSDPTGYLYLRARYFDPTTAQFLSVDPLVSATGDPYGYTVGNPLQFADPLGLWPDIDFDLGQTAKAIFAPVIASWNLVSGVAYSQTPWGRADQVNQFLQVYADNCGGIEGAWAAINVSFNPMYSAVASGAEAYDQFRAGNYGDALIAADEALLITATTAAGAKSGFSTARGAAVSVGTRVSEVVTRIRMAARGDEGAVRLGPLGDGGIPGASGSVAKLAEQFGYTTREVRTAIHTAKREASFPGNPDVVVDQWGEIYPVGRDGVAGDSIGNLLDYLGGGL